MLIAKNAVRGQQVYNLALAIDPACPMRAAAVQLVRNVLQEVGTILVMRPDENTSEIPDVIEVVLASHHELDWVERKSKIPTVVSSVYAAAGAEHHCWRSAHRIGRRAAPRASAANCAAGSAAPQPDCRRAAGSAPRLAAGEGQGSRRANRAARAGASQEPRRAPPSATENVIRVEAERIDVVLDLVGELIIAKSMMQELLAEMNRSLANSPLRAKTADVLVFQSQILNKLQRAVMKIRMVPVEQMFRRLPRVVRDTAKQTRPRGRTSSSRARIRISTRAFWTRLAEPMMHLLRNAVDHGIEPPLERAAAGKPPAGTIRLNAYHQGNQVVIEISDDGRGIDLPGVVKMAVSHGVITAEQATRISESDALDLIFHAGLSTSGEVTEISGRGIGMDVVKAVMDRLKGIDQRAQRSRRRHHLPPEGAAHPGHHQGPALPRLRAPLRRAPGQCAGDSALAREPRFISSMGRKFCRSAKRLCRSSG